MLSEHEISERICDIYAENEPDPDEYQQWAVKVMPEYQQLLEDMGLGAWPVIGTHPNDHWLDQICIRAPWGEVVVLPDPHAADEPGPALGNILTLEHEDGDEGHWDFEETLLVFATLAKTVETFDHVRNMRAAIDNLEQVDGVVLDADAAPRQGGPLRDSGPPPLRDLWGAAAPGGVPRPRDAESPGPS